MEVRWWKYNCVTSLAISKSVGILLRMCKQVESADVYC